ncbi:MAG: NACHT domain-containing protein [Bdellovibrionales bacterium]|nr:NACHT domain-containing protein [Bdellovibrionales bacterium]
MWIKDFLLEEQDTVSFINLKLSLLSEPKTIAIADSKSYREISSEDFLVDFSSNFNESYVLAGEPGTGKSTLLLQIIAKNIQAARQNTQLPIPIYLKLDSWKNDFETFDDWLIEEMETAFGIPKSISRALIQGNQIQFFLDGLDEVDYSLLHECANTVADFANRYWNGLFIATRLQQFQEVSRFFSFARVFEVQTLTRDQVEEYLIGASWDKKAVRGTLKYDSELKEFANTPFMLKVLLQAFQSLSSVTTQPTKQQLSQFKEVEDRRGYVIKEYIDLGFERLQRKISKGEFIRQMTMLAILMKNNQQSMLFLDYLQPRILSSKKHKAKYWFASIGLLLLTSTLMSWLLIFLSILGTGGLFQLTDDIKSNLLITIFGTGAIGFFSGCLITGVSSLANRGINLFEKTIWSWTGTRIGFIVGFLLGILFWGIDSLFEFFNLSERFFLIELLIFAFLLQFSKWFFIKDQRFSSFVGGMLTNIVYFTIFSSVGTVFATSSNSLYELVFVGALSGLVAFSLGFNEVSKRNFPNRGVKLTLRTASIYALLLGGAVFFFLNINTTSTSTSSSADVYVFLFSLFNFGGVSIIRIYTLRFILYREEYLPKNLKGLLDLAIQMKVMRVAGGAYMFMHPLLQSYFVSTAHKISHSDAELD